MIHTRSEPSHEPLPTTDIIRQNVHGYALPILAAGVVIALLYWARVVFITMTIAIIIALILEPFVGLLNRLHVPRSIATFIVCIFAVLVLYFGGLAAWNQLSGLAIDAPVVRDRIAAITQRVDDRLQKLEDSASRLLPTRKPELPAPVVPPPVSRKSRRALPPPVPAPNPIQEVRIHDDRNPIVDYIYPRLGTLYEMFLMSSFVPFLVYFMLSWRDHFYRGFLRLFEGGDRVAAAHILEGVASNARAYVVGNFFIGVILGALSWAAFATIRMPYAFLIGILSGLLSLMPYLGLPLALVPPLVAGFASGVPSSLLFFAALSVLALHLIAMNILYPKLVGARLHLNPLVVTISLMFWGFLWDAAGLALAIPITAGIKAVCDNVEGLKAYGRFLGD